MKALKLLFFSGILAFSSCTTDPCVDTTCYNDGVCDDGTCMCTDWYEGMDCSTEERTKYYGNYTGVLNYYAPDGTSAGNNQGTFPVSVGSIINELDGDGIPFLLTASGTGSFDIPITQVNDPDLGSTFWQGSGSFSGNILAFNGSMDAQGQTFTFSFNGTK